METTEELKAEFQTKRTLIISDMLDNPDEYGIYPTTKCFKALDKLWNELSESYAKQHAIAFAIWSDSEECIIALQDDPDVTNENIEEKAYDKWKSQ
ncbi:hypothetical protein ES705_19839 [subsurface metagenome]